MSEWNELVPVEDAAKELGMTPARLRGFVARGELRDPIGDMRHVYRGSLTELAKTLNEA
jgi:hypothetical protein